MKKNYFAISGVKDSGKTTLISQLINQISKQGFTISTIKHDGHDFDPDVPGTDSYIHRKSGAKNIAIYSKNKYQVIKKESRELKYFLSLFDDTDLIILEGFKDREDIPKVEVVRKEVSKEPYSKDSSVIAYYTDLPIIKTNKKVFKFGEVEELAEYLLSYFKLK